MTTLPDRDWAPDAEDDDDLWADPPTGTASRNQTARRAIAAIGLLLVVAVGAVMIGGVLAPGPKGVDVRFVVPDGTAAGLRAGTKQSPLPATIELRTVDRLVIVNEDDEPFTFGAFQVRVGETFSHRFSRRGTYGEVCTLHPAGSVNIVVT